MSFLLFSFLTYLWGWPALGRFTQVPYSFHFLTNDLAELLGMFVALEVILPLSPNLYFCQIVFAIHLAWKQVIIAVHLCVLGSRQKYYEQRRLVHQFQNSAILFSSPCWKALHCTFPILSDCLWAFSFTVPFLPNFPPLDWAWDWGGWEPWADCFYSFPPQICDEWFLSYMHLAHQSLPIFLPCCPNRLTSACHIVWYAAFC